MLVIVPAPLHMILPCIKTIDGCKMMMVSKCLHDCTFNYRKKEFDGACRRYNKSFCVLAAAEYFNNPEGVTRLAHFRTQFNIPARITNAQMENWIERALLGHKLSSHGKQMADASRAWVLGSTKSKRGIGPLMLELVKAKYMH